MSAFDPKGDMAALFGDATESCILDPKGTDLDDDAASLLEAKKLRTICRGFQP
jgi:hypothetical protein